MLQRIQTVYLLLVLVCTLVGLCTPLGYFHQSGFVVADFYNLRLTPAEGLHDYTPWALFVLLVLVAVSAFCCIFMYKHRMAQVRLAVLGGLLLVGYYLVFGYFLYAFIHELNAEFTVSWTLSLPLVAVILEYLAFRGIMKDELLVRSLNRLR